jgi:peroxiredoxin
LHDIQAAGASLVAISPQLPEFTKELIQLQKLTYPVLYDKHNDAARKFGLVFHLPEELQKVYRTIGVDLEKQNGDTSWELPIPGTYVIGRDGVVKYASADPDYTNRPEPDELVEVIRAQKAA